MPVIPCFFSCFSVPFFLSFCYLLFVSCFLSLSLLHPIFFLLTFFFLCVLSLFSLCLFIESLDLHIPLFFLHVSFLFLVLCYAHLSPLLPKVFSVTSFLLHALSLVTPCCQLPRTGTCLGNQIFVQARARIQGKLECVGSNRINRFVLFYRTEVL